MLTEYNRFEPDEGKLVQRRKVTIEILFEKEDSGARSFQPEITENSLTIFDCSQRGVIFEFYKKGLSEQNAIYTLTNHFWNFGYYSNIVARDAENRKIHLIKHGIQ